MAPAAPRDVSSIAPALPLPTISIVPYTTILFDVGETLVHVPRPAPVYQRILAEHGCTLALEDVEQIVEESRRLVGERVPQPIGEDLTLNCDAARQRRELHVATILELAGAPNPATASAAFFALYVGPDFFTLYPDVPATLRELHAAGYRLGIVSNWEPRLELLCAAHGIGHFFDFAVVSELEGYSKPHPRLYQRALEIAGAEPGDVLHVGDKLREDIEGAAQVGIRAVLIDRAGTTEEYEPRITRLSELPALLACEPDVHGTARHSEPTLGP